MNWMYYKTQLTLILRNKKNILALLLAVIAAIAVAFHYSAVLLPPEKANLTVIRNEVRTLQAAPKLFSNEAAVLKADQTILAGVKGPRATLIAGLDAKLQAYDVQWHNRNLYTYPAVYYTAHSLNAYPITDGHFGVTRLRARLKYYRQHPTVRVDLAVYNEQTFLHTLARLSAQWLPWAAIALCAILACDRLTEDWHHRSVTATLPLSMRRQLGLKTLAVLTPVAAVLLFTVLVLAVATIPRYGIGLGAGVTQYLGGQFTYQYRVLSMPVYFLRWTGLLALTCWFTVRLLLVLQLVVRNEFVALASAACLFLSPLLYYVRSEGAFDPFPVPVFLPMTFTGIGRVLTGTEHFFYATWLMNGAIAVAVWLGWGLLIELALYAGSQSLQRERVIL
ncbi:hypothetical protein [Lacticaseibacillus absianus]|uniref:hypothetical protein n=1 Tax=Lacticaseibacillus absianus TaxID=2729623 RepID=UPI0015CB3C04|nr:hypothetical protein [Lacticaseibacillus absianus]